MLSFGLVLALFLLGPGFATYAGGFVGLQGGRFHAAPPAPSSIFSFVIVAIAALFWHALWATMLAVDAAYCNARGFCVALPFDPDVYTVALDSIRPGGPRFSPDEIAAFLATNLLLSLVAFAAALGLVRVGVVAKALRRPLYGLYAELVSEVTAASDARAPSYVIAYVITDLSREGASLGYVGLLENLQVGSDKAIAAVSLLDCNTFMLKLGRTVSRTPDLRTDPIERLVLAGSRIHNVAFAILDRPI